MRATVRRAGNPSSRSPKGIWRTSAVMRKPTRMRAGAVACAGTMPATGAKKRARRKHTPVTTEASPVRAPVATPADDSTKVVAEEAPAAPPAAAASESTRSTRFRRGRSPSGVSQPPSAPTPITVPMVSKKSESIMEKIVTTAVITPTRAKTERSMPDPRLEKSGHAVRVFGITACPGRGNARPPVHALTIMARMVVAKMPRRRPAVMPRDWNHSTRSRPNSATATGAEVSGPRVTGTPGGPGFTMPEALRPMKRMKSPMPTPMACFSEAGMAFMIASRSPVTTKHGDHQAFEQHHAHGGLPRQLHARHQLIRDGGVQPHAGGEGERIVRHQPHGDRHHARHQAGAGLRRREGRALALQGGNAREAQDGRVHEDDVGHDHEGGQAAANLAAHGRARASETEAAFEHPSVALGMLDLRLRPAFLRHHPARHG